MLTDLSFLSKIQLSTTCSPLFPVLHPLTETLTLILCELPTHSPSPDHYCDLLPNEEINQAMRIKNSSRQKQFLSGRSILRLCLSQLTGTPPQNLVLTRTEKGKLFLPDSPFQFNLSHSQNLLALAFSQSHPVGVDLESSSRQRNFSRLAKRWFSAEEAHWITQSSDPQSIQQKFLSIWTQKEAFAKATGEGLTGNIQDLPTLLQQPSIHHQQIQQNKTHFLVFSGTYKNQFTWTTIQQQ